MMKIERINKSLKLLNISVVVIIFVVLVCVYLFCCVSRSAPLPLVKPHKKVEAKSLSLFPSDITSSHILPDLAEILTFLGRNSRPDCDSAGYTLALGLKTSSERRYFRDGEMGYLAMEDGKWVFSDMPTPISFFPLGGPHIEVKLSFDEVKERDLCILDQERWGAIPGEAELGKKGVLGGDTLKTYLGDPVGSAPRLTRSDGSLLDLSEGLLMSWSGSKWVSGVTYTECYPLARVTLKNERVHFELWDQSGFCKNEISLPITISTPNLTLEVQNAKKRSKNGFSCTIDGKEHLLNSGDWLFEQEGKWGVVETHEVKGDLIRIENLRDGHCLATYFSKDRSSTMSVAFPLKQLRPEEKGHPLNSRLQKEL